MTHSNLPPYRFQITKWVPVTYQDALYEKTIRGVMWPKSYIQPCWGKMDQLQDREYERDMLLFGTKARSEIHYDS